jgi:DNA modification methylase
MQIKLAEISNIKPYENNPRKLSEKAIEKVAMSLKEYGFRQPIVVDKNMVIVAGHTRYRASKKLGLKQVPISVIDNLSEEQINAYRIADNRTAEESEWDSELLKMEIKELEAKDFKLDLLGFNDEQLNNILFEEKQGLTDEDEVPETPEDPISKLGDIWKLGNHRVMCGNSVDYEDVHKLMNNKIADLVNTDPPYGVNYQSNMRTKSDKFDLIKNDDKILDITPIIDKFSKGWVFIWTTWKVIDKWIDNTKSFGFPTNMVVWHKGGGGIGDLKKTFSTDYEMALVFNRGAELCGKRIGSVWSLQKDKAIKYKHPTQKPVELSVEAIDKTTNPKSIVMDLFLGSGSSLIACEKMDRICYGMELDPIYCDVIVKRWENFTGKKAEIENGQK